MNRILFSLLLLLSTGVQAVQFKIAALAPDGSTWMQALRDAAEEVEQRTDGAIRMRFYPGGVMGDSATVLRRMRLGQLHGGVFAVGELAGIAPETNLYSLPFQFRDVGELQQLRDEFDPVILEALREGGLVAPSISLAGFAYLFSRDRIASTEDVSSDLRVWIPKDDPLSRRTLEEIGASAVPLNMADVYTGLQTGTINTFANTLSGAIILQWHTRAKYMLDLPVLMTAGVLAVDEKVFARVEPEHQQIWLDVFGTAMREQEVRTSRENQDALQALVGEGIEIVTPDEEDAREWRRISDQVLDRMLASGEFEVPGYERLRARLAELRAEQPSDAP